MYVIVFLDLHVVVDYVDYIQIYLQLVIEKYD